MSKYSKEAKALFWVLLACVNYPVLTAIVRHLADLGLQSPQIVCIRNLTALSILVPFVFLRKEKMDIKIRNRSLYFLRIVFGLASMVLWFYGLGKLPLATATALSFSTPLFAAVAAVIILKEKMGVLRWSAVITGFIGTIIILRPGAMKFDIAAFAVLGGCFFTAIVFIIVKKLTKSETPFNMMFHMHLWMALFSIPLAFMAWKPIDANMLLWFYGVAVTSIIGQYSMGMAYVLVDVTFTLPFDFTRLVIASIIAYFAFGEVPNFYTYIGAGLIICSAIFIAHRESRKRKKALAARQLA